MEDLHSHAGPAARSPQVRGGRAAQTRRALPVLAAMVFFVALRWWGTPEIAAPQHSHQHS